MTQKKYVHILDEVQKMKPPEKGILSRTLYSDQHVKVVVFGFDAGEELSEHTASLPAVLNFVKGEVELTLGGDRVDAKPGSWVYMTPKLPHQVLAKTPAVMLLTLIQSGSKK